MNAPKSTEDSNRLQTPPDFSLVLGGPLFQLLRRAHLSDDALGLVRLRIVGYLAAGLVAAPGALCSGRAPVGRERGRPLPEGCGGSCQAPGGHAPVDHCRVRRAPPHTSPPAAIPGTQIDPRQCDATVRGGDRFGAPAAQLGVRRSAAPRLRLWGRHPRSSGANTWRSTRAHGMQCPLPAGRNPGGPECGMAA